MDVWLSTAADGETFQAALDAAMRFGKGEMVFVSEKVCFIRGEGRLGLGRGAVRISGEMTLFTTIVKPLAELLIW